MAHCLLLLLLLLTPARSSQQKLLLSHVHLPDWSMDLAQVSQDCWQTGRLPPTTGQGLVDCAASCVQKYKADGSCNAIMYVKDTDKGCHMGTADLVEEGQASETVYRIWGAMAKTTTPATSTTTTTTTITTTAQAGQREDFLNHFHI